MMERHRMKILYSPASPYSNKVRMAAHHAGIAAESVLTETNANPPQLIDNNPLGKIPTLITDDGLAIYDSRAIMHFIDRETGGKLYPKNHEKRTRIEIFEALCDGICDSLLAIVYEKRFHPPEKVHQPWIDRQWEKVERGLDYLEANLPKTGGKLNAGHFALAATLRYIELRFAGEWQKGRPKLKNWPAKFEKHFPDYSKFKA
jgi:glutathione S-transferase